MIFNLVTPRGAGGKRLFVLHAEQPQSQKTVAASANFLHFAFLMDPDGAFARRGLTAAYFTFRVSHRGESLCFSLRNANSRRRCPLLVGAVSQLSGRRFAPFYLFTSIPLRSAPLEFRFLQRRPLHVALIWQFLYTRRRNDKHNDGHGNPSEKYEGVVQWLLYRPDEMGFIRARALA